MPGVAYADRMTIAALRCKGIDVASAVRTLRDGAPDRQPPSETLGMDGFYLDLGKTRKLGIGRMTFAGTGGYAYPRTQAAVDMENVVYAPPDAAGRQSLTNVAGADTLKGSLHLDMSITHSSDALDISPIAIEVEGIGKLRLTVGFSGVDAKLFKASRMDPAKLTTLGLETQFVGASAFFQDNGLLEHVAEAQGQRFNVSAEQFRTRLASAVAQNPTLATLPGGDGMRTAVSNFLLHGGTLRIVIAPPAPLNMAALTSMEKSNPVAALSALGLTVTRVEGGGSP